MSKSEHSKSNMTKDELLTHIKTSINKLLEKIPHDEEHYKILNYIKDSSQILNFSLINSEFPDLKKNNDAYSAIQDICVVLNGNDVQNLRYIREQIKNLNRFTESAQIMSTKIAIASQVRGVAIKEIEDFISKEQESKNETFTSVVASKIEGQSDSNIIEQQPNKRSKSNEKDDESKNNATIDVEANKAKDVKEYLSVFLPSLNEMDWLRILSLDTILRDKILRDVNLQNKSPGTSSSLPKANALHNVSNVRSSCS